MTGISRTNVYHLINNLEEREIVERKGAGRKITFRACQPRSLEILLKKQEDQIRDTRQLLRAELPSLEMNHALWTNDGGVYRFEGKDGIKRVYDELIRDRLPINAVLNRTMLWEFLSEHNEEQIKQRVKYKIKARSNYAYRRRSGRHHPYGFTDSKELRISIRILVERRYA